MDDLLERLRGLGDSDSYLADLADEAADEIERLQRENARLREALHGLNLMCFDDPGLVNRKPNWRPCGHCSCCKARAALQETGRETTT